MLDVGADTSALSAVAYLHLPRFGAGLEFPEPIGAKSIGPQPNVRGAVHNPVQLVAEDVG